MAASTACDGSGRAAKGAGTAGGKTVALKVLPGGGDGKPDGKAGGQAGGGKPHSNMGLWRAGVLIAVHAAIIAHVVQWLVSGMQDGIRNTLSPVEPSESMFTLEGGGVNAGFVMFVLAILSTALFGRYFCGWLCHVVALQDLCGWMMKKVGVHPKPWRSRLLLWVPLGLAAYMFLWPTFRREVVRPALTAWLGEMPAWMGEVMPLRGFTQAFIVEDFWATFPAWYVAIPFLLICGFATVYFMGAKAFCTYGCPYGGFFTPVDRVSPYRVRVTEDCHQCGHCTSVCTSNVRVHEEVRDYGMVVDPGCMKCMDCVSACPNGALYMGFGKPAVGAKPRSEERVWKQAQEKRVKRYDLTLGEELVIGAVFLAMLLGYRGMYGAIPLLMAVGIAGVVSFMLHKTWRVLRDANVRGPYWQLKKGNRVTAAGWVFVAAAVVLGLVGLKGAVMSHAEFRGDMVYNRLPVTREAVFSGGYSPTAETKAAAERAVWWYRVAGGVGDGGIGFYTSWGNWVRLSWLHAVAGDMAASEAALRQALRGDGIREDLVLGLAQLMRMRCATPAEIEAMLQGYLAERPELDGVRRTLRERLLAEGRNAEAITLYVEATAQRPADVEAVNSAAELLMRLGRPADAQKTLEAGLAERPKSPVLKGAMALAVGQQGQVERAITLLREAVDRQRTPERVNRLADVLASAGRLDEAEAELRRLLVEEAPTVLPFGIKWFGNRAHAWADQRPLADAARRLARIMTQRGAPRERILDDLVRLARAHPENEPLRQTVVSELLGTPREGDGRALYEAARAYRHADAGTFRNAAGYALYIGEPDRAIATLREAVKKFPNVAELHGDLGAALLVSGNETEALAEFAVARRLAPHADPMAALADQMMRTNQAERLMGLYGRVLADDPTHEPTAFNAAGLLLTQQHADRALAVCRSAMARHACSARLLDYAGRSLFLLGKDAEALPLVQRAVDLEPTPDRLANLVELLERLGREPEARAVRARLNAVSDPGRQVMPEIPPTGGASGGATGGGASR